MKVILTSNITFTNVFTSYQCYIQRTKCHVVVSLASGSNCPETVQSNSKLETQIIIFSAFSALKYKPKLTDTTNCLIHKATSYFNLAKILILQSGDIESNPGPKDHAFIPLNDPLDLTIFTYNTQGLLDYKKHKRFNAFLHSLPCRDNCIIFLQETHFKADNRLKFLWKNGSHQAFATDASSGTAILYNESFFDKINDKGQDLVNGRWCYIEACKGDDIYLFINIHAPCCKTAAKQFYRDMEILVENKRILNPTLNIIIGGDFNIVFDQAIDSINRAQTNEEKSVLKIVNNIISKFSLTDSYRLKNNWGGYTWGRNNPTYIRSRLDHIFIPSHTARHVTTTNVTKYPNESDHSLLYTAIFSDKIQYGPGIIRCNASLTDSLDTKNEIRQEIIDLINSIDSQIDLFTKWDLIKQGIRNIYLKHGKVMAKANKTALHYANEELIMLNNKLDKLLNKLDTNVTRHNDPSNLFRQIDSLREAIDISEDLIKDVKDIESKKMIFRSRTKWAEEGEKSSKYFLNIIKANQKKTIISNIKVSNKTFHKQEDIKAKIKDFYKNLYDKSKITQLNHNFFTNLPQLTQTDQDILAKDLNINELHEALMSCKESAPGPDGIPYKVYKDYWDILGQYIIDIWIHAEKTKKLALSQRYSIITLIDKKDKDKTKIENLRPISLTNCDIKICTKALALRTSKILEKILVNTQCGYVPGRQIADNSRYLEEIIQICEQEKIEGYIVTLDAKKAFDSVDHGYMEACLKAYGFPSTYIDWIKTLYNDLTASVMVNGFTTDTFNILRSVKQGDALSCALFVICIDPLLRAIEKSTDVKMIQIATFDNYGAVKTLAYADDITVICRDLDSIQNVLDIYNTFSKISGIELNIPKTEIMKLGCERDNRETNIQVTYEHERYEIKSKTQIKICGLSFSTNADVSYQYNINGKIDKFESVINLWKTRNLSIAGKIIIIKTLGLSQITASLQQTMIKNDELKRIDQAITRFIWNKSNTSRPSGLIANSLLKADYLVGGLKSPDIYSINDSIKLKNLVRTLQLEHPVSTLYRKILLANNIDMLYKPFRNTLEKNMTLKQAKTYILQAHHVHRRMSSHTEKDLILLNNLDPDMKMHKNYHITIHNHLLETSSYLATNQKNSILRLKRKNVKTFADLNILKSNTNDPNYNQIALDIHQIFHTYPKWWPELCNKARRSYQNQNHNDINVGLNKWVDSTKVKASQIRLRLMESNVHQNAFDRIKTNNGIELANANNPFITLRKVTNITQLRILQYKTLMTIYPTRALLFKWGAVEDDKCIYCQQKETVTHVLMDCQIASDTYINLMDILETIPNKQHDRQINLSRESITTLYQLPSDIATLLILIKSKLLLQRENKLALSQDAILAIANSQYQIEKKIAYNQGKTSKHKLKWATLAPILHQTSDQ